MKKILTLLGTFFMVMLLLPTYVWAAESHASAVQVPVWLCIPFAGLLLCIAVMPLLRAEWWEAHQPLVVFMWIILLVVPFAIVYGAGDTFETVLECIVNDYLTFIVLLFGLFCVSGNITVGGDFAGSPRVNACLLALGTLLSSCIGTTGASMLMEKKKKTYYGIFHFSDFQYGWLSYANRRSAASNGIYAWSTIFLEHAFIANIDF